MRLAALHCRRLPGIDAPFQVEAFAPGLNLVVGPNGIGKSSLCRAIAATLWPEQAAAAVEVEAEWDHAGHRLRATCRDRRGHWEGAVPALPAAHLARGYTLGVRDLLDPVATADRAIGEAIRVEMAGGYDLGSVRRGVTLGPRHGQHEARELQAAEQARARIVATHRALAEEAAALPELEQARARALAAQERLDRLTAAADLARARAAVAAARARVATLPATLAHLTGQERDQLAKLSRAAAAAGAEVAEVEADLARLRARAAATALPGGPVDEVAGNAALASARALIELEGEVRRAESERAAAAAEEAAIGGTGELDAAEVARLEGLVERLLDHRQRLREVTTRLDLLGEAEGSEEPARLHQAESALARWLAVAEGGPPLPRWLPLLGMLALVAGIALIFVIGAYAALPLGAGVGLLSYFMASKQTARRGAEQRAVAQDLYAEGRLAPLAAWTRAAVEERLGAVREELARATQQRVAAEERRRLQGEQAALAAAGGDLAVEEQAWRARLGIAAGPSLHLLDLGHRFDQRRRVVGAVAAAAARLAKASADAADQRAAVEGFFAPYLTAGGTPVTPAPALASAGPALGAAVETVVERSRNHRQAVREVAELERRRAQTVARLEAAEAERHALLARAGVAVEADLVVLLDRLPDYRQAAAEVERQEGRIAELEARLADEPVLRVLSAKEADQRLAACREEAATLDGLARQVGDIEGRIREATEGDALEASRAVEGVARAALASRRAEAFEAAAAAFLLDLVEEEHQEVARPPVLARASGWFAAFTHQRYTVRVADHGELVAEESDSGAVRGLAELSDGTRAQLLLAVRVAFATHHEAGVALPLILDEALSLADPERFDAVASALLALAHDGRQIFYLTANPGDCGRWSRLCAAREESPPHLIDLAAVRLGQHVLDLDSLTVAPAVAVPPPAGYTAEQYGVALGVAPPDPERPAALDLFFLLRDDLPLLYRLRAGAHVATVGQWRTLARGGGGAAVASSAEAARLDALGQLAEATFAAWRQGRGRAVERPVLVASGAVSDRYLDPLAELAAEVGGDARALLARLERRGGDPRSHGFRANKREELAAYLRTEGYLDPRPPLDPETLRARLLAELAPALIAGALSAAEVSQRVAELTALLDRSLDERLVAHG